MQNPKVAKHSRKEPRRASPCARVSVQNFLLGFLGRQLGLLSTNRRALSGTRRRGARFKIGAVGSCRARRWPPAAASAFRSDEATGGQGALLPRAIAPASACRPLPLAPAVTGSLSSRGTGMAAAGPRTMMGSEAAAQASAIPGPARAAAGFAGGRVSASAARWHWQWQALNSVPSAGSASARASNLLSSY